MFLPFGVFAQKALETTDSQWIVGQKRANLSDCLTYYFACIFAET
jgi:hypothetical protein